MPWLITIIVTSIGPGGGMNPKFLKIEDFEKIKESDCLFARKFNMDIDYTILDLIDIYNSKASFSPIQHNNSTSLRT